MKLTTKTIMHKYIITLLFLFIAYTGYNQNLLSPNWKISAEKIQFSNNDDVDLNSWNDISLLLSWERQGYSWIDEDCAIAQNFHFPENSKSLTLDFSLQASVINVLFNNQSIGGSVENTFWSERGKITSIAIPNHLIQPGINNIRFEMNGLSYTGGKSHNTVTIKAENSNSNAKVSINIPATNHVFNAKQNPSLNIVTESNNKGKVVLVIKNDFHQEFVNKSIEIESGNNETKLNLDHFNLKPGFYECTAVFNNGTYAGDVQWFSIDPENILCNHEKTEGFDDYWQDALKELKSIAPQFKLTKDESLCSANRNGYIVEMQSLGNLTIRGYYWVPKAKGKYPAVLHVPGYSYGWEHRDGFINRNEDVAELALCVRGHGISKDVFNPWDEQTLWSVGACNKDSNIYRSIYMDCVRAIDFLLSQDQVDHSKIAVVGGSQGGGLTLATAALCSEHIAACAFFDPFLCDIKHQTEIRTIVQKEFELFTEAKGNNCDVEQIYKVQEFNDTKNFADKIKCPTTFLAAFFDDDCPVHCGFAAYNLINAPKNYMVFPKDSHLGESGEYDRLFNEALKLMNRN